MFFVVVVVCVLWGDAAKWCFCTQVWHPILLQWRRSKITHSKLKSPVNAFFCPFAIHQLCIDMSWYWHRIPSVLEVLFLLLLTRCKSLVLLLWVVGALLGMRKKGRYFFEVELHFGCESPQVGLLSAQFEMAPRTHPKNLTKKRECSLSEFLISSRNHRFKTNFQSRKKLDVFFIDPTFGGPKGCISWVWEMINMAGELMVNTPSCGMEVGTKRDWWRSNDALMIRLMDQILHQLTMHNI